MRSPEWIKEEYLKASNRAATFHSIEGSGLRSKLRRIQVGGYKYLFYSIVQKLGLRYEATIKLFWGKPLKLPLQDIDTKFLYYFGHLGYEEESLILYFIKHFKAGDVFYDVGANYGFYTHLANELITQGECHAFEPNKTTFNYLKRNLANSGSENEIHVNKIALSDHEGEVAFFSATEIGASGISTTSEVLATMRDRRYTPTSVPCTTLDSYVKDHTAPTIIKIDIEGGELEMLKGAETFLASSTPTIALEVIRGEQGEAVSRKAAEYLVQLGYAPHRLSRDGMPIRLDAVNFDDLEYSYGNWIFTKHA